MCAGVIFAATRSRFLILAGMTQKDLAKAASLSQQTIADFERGAHMPHPNNLRAIFSAFEERGIIFQKDGDKFVGLTLAR
jgi:transcriptional regulator with XRE-family HTH domain